MLHYFLRTICVIKILQTSHTLSHTHSHTHTYTHSHIHTLTLTHTHTHNLTHTISHTHTYRHTHTLTLTHTHTIRILNTYCLSTAKMVARTRLSVKLLHTYIACLVVSSLRLQFCPCKSIHSSKQH